MANMFPNESMLDVFIYETSQNIEQLEKTILASEKIGYFAQNAIDEIFRIMHTIKGSSAMMLFDNITSLAHTIEDLFYYIRDEKPENVDYLSLSDLILEGMDFIRLELEKIKNSDHLDGNPSPLIDSINGFLNSTRREGVKTANTRPNPPSMPNCYVPPTGSTAAIDLNGYEVIIFFEDGCEMENIRAFSIIHNLKDITEFFCYSPEDITDDIESVQVIRESGFKIAFKAEQSLQELHDFFAKAAFIQDFQLTDLSDEEINQRLYSYQNTTVRDSSVITPKLERLEQMDKIQTESKVSHQSIISVDVAKLDKLMNLMGEMVITEAMVTQNPEIQSLQLDSFFKAARQLHKITNEIQDMVMSIRMVPLSASFHKMHRIARDISRKLSKELEVTLIGEETEVDKNIIEHISDPLMHLVRNAVDHGIEYPEIRTSLGKSRKGHIILEAKNTGSDVLITIKDDGSGINKGKILQKATELGLISNSESESTDKEIYNLIFLPGFSTNDSVTELSGRGVGMDVVTANMEAIGGSTSIDSTEGVGTVTTLKIPLTLAIIDGMNIRVGDAKYTLPTTPIREIFQAKVSDIIQDPEGSEMIMVRGECYSILRLHELFAIEPDFSDLTKGIMLIIEHDNKCLSLFADELLGQHQVVVKSLPSYMRNIKKAEGLAGCTLLGDGGISLILNISELVNMN